MEIPIVARALYLCNVGRVRCHLFVRFVRFVPLGSGTENVEGNMHFCFLVSSSGSGTAAVVKVSLYASPNRGPR